MPTIEHRRPTRRSDRRPTRVTISLVLVAAFAVLLGACASPTEEDSLSATYGLPDVERALEAETWVLDGQGSSPEIDTDTTVTLEFDGGRVAGQAPCNRYHGGFELDGHDIRIGPLAGTMMACDEAVDAAERAYFSALEAVDTVDVTDPTRLELTGGNISLVFDRLDPETAILGRWDIVSIARDDALVSPVEGSSPTIEFGADGTLSLAGGCNPITSTWSLDGSVITVGVAGSGMAACDEPAGVMDQDAALADAVESARRVEIGDDLRLLDDHDRMVIVATRQSE